MTDWWHDDLALAFVITEQARRVVHDLRERELAPDPLARLWVAHDGLGTAGFVLSGDLPDGDRQNLAAMVARHGPVILHADPRRAAVALTVHAEFAIERCLQTPWLSWTAQHAHRPVRAALGELSRLVGAGRTQDLRRLIISTGQAERSWQEQHLRPDRAEKAQAS